jgi:hypothetical protein
LTFSVSRQRNYWFACQRIRRIADSNLLHGAIAFHADEVDTHQIIGSAAMASLTLRKIEF